MKNPFDGTTMWTPLVSSLLLFLLPLPTLGSVFCERSAAKIQVPSDSTKNFPCAGVANGKTKFIWKTTNTNTEGFSDDEYYVNVVQNGNRLYRSSQKFNQASGTMTVEAGTPKLGGYNVQFECNLEFSILNCEDGNMDFKLVDCGCPGDKVPIIPCNVDSMEKAADAVCDTACDSGLFYDFEKGCVECENFKVLSTADIDYSGAINQDQCGVPGTTGFWHLAATGSVGVGGTVTSWSLAKSLSTSDGKISIREALLGSVVLTTCQYHSLTVVVLFLCLCQAWSAAMNLHKHTVQLEDNRPVSKRRFR